MVTARARWTGASGSPRLVLARRAPALRSTRPAPGLAILGDRLLVLDVQSLSLYQRTAGTWQPLESRPLAVGRTWPRDPRGRLRVAGDRFEAWLPGLACTGAVAPLAVTCADDSGRGRSASRTAVSTPGESLHNAGRTAVLQRRAARRRCGGALARRRPGRRAHVAGRCAAGGRERRLPQTTSPDLLRRVGAGSTIVAVERAPGADAMRCGCSRQSSAPARAGGLADCAGGQSHGPVVHAGSRRGNRDRARRWRRTL